jgi:hypothetical protein
MKYLAFLLLALSAPAQAKAEVRFHFGDDTRWANPSFDDSSWPLVRPGVQTLPDFHSDGYSWFRYRLPIPASGEPLALRVVAREFPGQLYVNGKELGGWGTFPPAVTHPAGIRRISFVLPQGAAQPGGTLSVAMRVWIPFVIRAPQDAGFWLGFAPSLEVGPREQMELRNALADATARSRAVPMLYLNLTILLYGLAVYLFGRALKSPSEVLLFAMVLIFFALQAGEYLVTFFPAWDRFPYFWWDRLCNFAAAVSFYCFCWRLFRLRWRYLTPFVLAWAAIELTFLAANRASTMSLTVELFAYWRWAELASDGGIILIAAWLFLRGVYSRPVMLTIALSFASFVATIWRVIPYEAVVGGVEIDIQTIVFLGVVISMSWLLLGRAWRTWREQQGLSAEFEAAREMQESLVQRLPATPGFAVDAAYRPASQVGGDFYRVFPAGNGAILVVVGDVSGKGLKAAMTVSGLVCAMETIETRMPGPFLVKLNHAAKAHLKSGFVTCCAALMEPNGEVRIANAGHLAPYADGREVEVEAGLPLGVVPDVEYPETAATGDRFTFLSDGVLEAANSAHELFGFDRSREISTQPAAAIAQAAQTWGQNDDITVVTVSRRDQ